MALNLIDLAKDYLTSDVLSKMSSLVGESPAATQKAMGAIVPSLAASLVIKDPHPEGLRSCWGCSVRAVWIRGY